MATAWSPQQRRNSRAEYQRLYKPPHPAKFEIVVVPEDIEILTEHGPCGNCGQARGRCRHRWWLS